MAGIPSGPSTQGTNSMGTILGTLGEALGRYKLPHSGQQGGITSSWHPFLSNSVSGVMNELPGEGLSKRQEPIFNLSPPGWAYLEGAQMLQVPAT